MLLNWLNPCYTDFVWKQKNIYSCILHYSLSLKYYKFLKFTAKEDRNIHIARSLTLVIIMAVDILATEGARTFAECPIFPQNISFLAPEGLKHGGPHQMADILQTTISKYVFLNLNVLEFWIKFHWNVFLGSNWQYVSIGSGCGLMLNRWQVNTGTNVDCCMASLRLNELTHLPLVPHICISVSIGSDNGLSPVRRQAII